ncbi:hypothetical protein KIPB_013581, partial [Kipferlia bialata]
ECPDGLIHTPVCAVEAALAKFPEGGAIPIAAFDLDHTLAGMPSGKRFAVDANETSTSCSPISVTSL